MFLVVWQKPFVFIFSQKENSVVFLYLSQLNMLLVICAVTSSFIMILSSMHNFFFIISFYVKLVIIQ